MMLYYDEQLRTRSGEALARLTRDAYVDAIMEWCRDERTEAGQDGATVAGTYPGSARLQA